MSPLESRVLYSSVPAAPSSLSATATSSQIQLHWKDNSNVESGFEIFRGTSKTNLAKVGTAAKNATSYSQTPPKKDTTYYYEVRAINGSVESKATSIVSGKVSSTATTSTSSTGTSTKTTSTPSGTVIHIGPNEAVKSLDAAKWPTKGGSPVTFILDYSSTPYTVSQHFLTGNLTIEPADPNKRPTIKLPVAFKKQSAASYIAQNPTLTVSGTLDIHDINTVGGIDTILLGSLPGGNIDCERVQMTDGGALWRGSGGNSIFLKDNQILGRPRANVYSNYDHTVNTVVIDNSDTSVPVQQGGSIVNGQPIGEAAIRIMDVNSLTLKHIVTKPWFYKSGQEWKQDVQLRPSSKHIQVIDCAFYQPDVGDMTWRSPAMPIQEVDFIGDTFTKSPNITNGVSVITFSDTLIGGKSTTKTV